MKLRQLNPNSCRTYLITSEKNRETVLIDPVLERAEEYLKLIDQEHLNISYIIDTHTHADHLSGGSVLADHLGVPYAMHQTAKQKCVSRKLADDETLRFGNARISCLHTPGHTNDSITLIIGENILTGDFLFIGEAGAGRTDLPTGSPSEHFDSLRKLSKLPDSYLVYPAHEYHGHTFSTMAEERKKNPTLRFDSKDGYLKWLSNLTFQPAPWMLDVIKANNMCTRDPQSVYVPADQAACEVQAMSDTVTGVSNIAAEEVKQKLLAKADIVVIDVRNQDEYYGEFGHIEGSILIPLADLPNRIDEIKRMGKTEIITVCTAGTRSKAAAEILNQAGLPNAFCMTGGMKRWRELV